MRGDKITKKTKEQVKRFDFAKKPHTPGFLYPVARDLVCKTLLNGLTNAGNLGVTKEQILAALEQMGLPATIRGEALTLEQFGELSNILKK